MADLAAALAPYLPLLVALGVLLLGVDVVWTLMVARRVRRLRMLLAGLTRDSAGRSLEAVLEAHLRRVDAVGLDLAALDERAATIEFKGRRALQRVGLVRFNPFEDTGSNQSFTLALLDDLGDGVILTSLHSRQGTRVYAKQISGGQAAVALSDEEADAIRLARAAPNHGVRRASGPIGLPESNVGDSRTGG